MAELAAAIVYQKQRISAFAENEKSFPLGMTSEQQRKEVVTLVDMLVRMRDTQIALGLVPQIEAAPTGRIQGAASMAMPSAQIRSRGSSWTIRRRSRT